MAIFLIRHGQSEFNAVFNGSGDPMIFDAPLTDLGRDQARAGRAKVRELGIKHVISSPLTRALQTASLMFDGIAPISVAAGHHEWLLHSCDVGRSPKTLAAEFPHITFDHLADNWWHHSTGLPDEIYVEPREVFQTRVNDFMRQIEPRSDRPLAIVGHGHSFSVLIDRMMENCEIHRFQ
jgi:broad specificity phosphatase PhoE